MSVPQIKLENLDRRLSDAVEQFWGVRTRQTEAQGLLSGDQDRGGRRGVTGGKHVDGLVILTSRLLVENGLPQESIYTRRTLAELPGYFRAQKLWDLVVVLRGNLVAAIEFKSQIGPSFGNNFNNRCEESIGSSVDLHTAYREGVFAPSPPPWLGYLMLLEDCAAAKSPVRTFEPLFRVLPEFAGAGYAQRYELALTRLLRERLYDGTCFLMSQRPPLTTTPVEPNIELSYRRFMTSLIGHALATISASGTSER